MECIYKEGLKECKSYATHTCGDCQYQVLYCKQHAGSHFVDTNHKNIGLIDGVYFKTQIKISISNIAKYTNDVIAEIRKTSLNTINQLKQANKNVNSIYELDLKSYDTKRISFIIDQVRDIDKKMDETPNETAQMFSTIFAEFEGTIENQKYENEKLISRIQELTDQIGSVESKLGTN